MRCAVQRSSNTGDCGDSPCPLASKWPSATLGTGRSVAGSSSSTAPRIGASGATQPTASPIPKRAATWCSRWPTCGTKRRRTRPCSTSRHCASVATTGGTQRTGRGAGSGGEWPGLLRQGQLPLPWPPGGVSMAMDLYRILMEAGQLSPPDIQLPIPQSAYEYVA